MRYQYLFLELPHGRKESGDVAGEKAEQLPQINKILTELGKQGWEAVSHSDATTAAGVRLAPRFLMRRELPDG